MASSFGSLRDQLNAFPNSFRLKRHEDLVYPKLDAMLLKLEREEKDLGGYDPVQMHHFCCVRNLQAFVLCKFNKTAEALGLMEEVMARSQGRNVMCLATRAIVILDGGDPYYAEEALEALQDSSPWQFLLAEAEMAFSYRKMGPPYNALCRESYENVITKIKELKLGHVDPDFFGGNCPNLDIFHVFWCYGAAVAIDRALDKNIQSNMECFDVRRNGDPERLLRQSCGFLKVFLEGSKENRARGWIKYIEIYKKYKQIEPKKNRSIKLKWLTPGNISVLQCLRNAVKDVERSSNDWDAIMRLGRLFLSGPSANLELAKRFLKQSLAIQETEFAHHQLSRAFTQELENETQKTRPNSPKQIRPQPLQHIFDYYKRFPGDCRLQQAIHHAKIANRLAGEASAMILTDIARCSFQLCSDPLDICTRDTILRWLRQALTLKTSTKGDRAKVFMHMGMIMEFGGERGKAKFYLKKSVEEAASGRLENYPSLPVLLYMLREEITNSEDSEELTLYELIEKIGRGTKTGEPQCKSASPAVLDYLCSKMRWFKAHNMIMEALISLKLLASMRDLSSQEREFALELALEVETRNTTMEDRLGASDYKDLFVLLVKSNARDKLVKLCVETERIVKNLLHTGIPAEEIREEISKELYSLPEHDTSLVADVVTETERLVYKMANNADMQHHLFVHLLKSSVASHHDILIYSCDKKEDKTVTRKFVEFIESKLGLEELCCWAQRDLVHVCGGEYEFLMTKALTRSLKVIVHVTPNLVDDPMDMRILTSALHGRGTETCGRFVMVETTGDPEFAFPPWCKGRDVKLVSLPVLDFPHQEALDVNRKLMRALLG